MLICHPKPNVRAILSDMNAKLNIAEHLHFTR